MSTDIAHNKVPVRRFFGAIEAGDFAVFDEIVAEGYNDHLPGTTPGRENLKRYFAGGSRPCRRRFRRS